MKTLATLFTFIVFAGTVFAAAPSNTTIVAARNAESKTINMHIRGTDHVKIGSAITAELIALDATIAQLTVENAKGSRFLETDMALEAGMNVVRFKVAEIPAGIYFIKVNVNGKSETTTFVVK